MSLLKSAVAVWKLPYLKKIGELDSNVSVLIHRQIIESKPLMRGIYKNWYDDFNSVLEQTKGLMGLPFVELGCGASHSEVYVPGVVKTDCMPSANAEAVVDAEKLPYADQSLRALLMSGVLHHVRYPERFLEEAHRCLAPGGMVCLIEPSASPLHTFMIHHFHPYEYFDASIDHWENTQIKGRLTQANNAMAYLIFERDRAIYEKKFPELQIVSIRRHTVIAYYLSGGVSYRSFAPFVPSGWILKLDQWLARIFPRLGTMMTVQLKKVET